MNRSRRRTLLFLFTQSSLVLLIACGGTSQILPGSASGDAPCPESACSSNKSWNPLSCMCEVRGDGGSPDGADAETPCPQIQCPAGSVQGRAGGACACVLIEAGVLDATPLVDAPNDVAQLDATHDSPDNSQVAPLDASPYDSTTYDAAPLDGSPFDATIYDAPYIVDATTFDSYYSYDSPWCGPFWCPPGYQMNAFCQCLPCSIACPSGQSPTAGCGGCAPCSTKCPAGFQYGNGCNCGPPGTDAAANGADGGSVTCLLQGNFPCSAGSWCPLGTCPDNTTEYGCYCNADGTASCSLVCPPPPACAIPGQGTCPYGAQCVYGDCATDASATALVCNCNSGGSASCYTSLCNGAEAGVPSADAGDGGVTCLLEGNYLCSAGSWCPLGVCPDNTTEYGCTCNPDGTATCKLTCPPPPACTIPGEGTCPSGTSCLFGTCTSNAATQLSCFCNSGYANCFTIPCNARDGAVE
jgi:hypothetical protein